MFCNLLAYYQIMLHSGNFPFHSHKKMHWLLDNAALWRINNIAYGGESTQMGYTTFKSLFSSFRRFFTLLPHHCVPYTLTYAPVWIATRSSDWSVCTWMFLLLCWGMNRLHVNVTDAQNWEKINFQIHYTLTILCSEHLN